MEEVSGPVIAIGLILSAVFVPVGFMGGITGRLYQQFAITIAMSVLLSVVNALTLSPALAGDAAQAADRQEDAADAVLQRLQQGVRRRRPTATSASPAILIRKMFRSLAFIGVLIYVIVVLVRQIPGGFVPEEDQGYIMVNAQLPDAASLERTDAVDEEGRGDSGEERGDRGLQHDQRLLAAHLAPTPRTWASSSCSSSRGRSGTTAEAHANGQSSRR